jgi:arylsulfatase A-like enzyme
MMTSTFPCEHGVRVDGERLRGEIVPLAEHLQRAGYATSSFIANGYVGKSSGLDRGFDHPHVIPSISGKTIERWFRPPADRPMFLYVHDIRPHDPYQAPVEAIGEDEPVALALRRTLNRDLQRYRKLTKVDFDAGRPVGQTDNAETQRETMSLLTRRRALIETLYDAEVRAADTIVGEIIAELRRLGRWENTLFVLTSDHGEEFAEHAGWQHDQSLYQELIRVPLIVRLPAGEGAGLRVAAPVSLIDLVATVGDLLGRPEMRERARGRSWLPIVRGSAAATAGTSPSEGAGGDLRIVAERHDQKKFFAPFVALRGHRNVAIRDGSWKAIWNIEPDTLELYELSTDPGEKRDRSADSPARANAMKQAARDWLAACPTPQQPVPKGPIDPSDEQQLRALGYID